MSDILTQIYYLVDNQLPYDQHPTPAEDALTATFTEHQKQLYEAYTSEAIDQIDRDRQRLFFFTLRMALNIP